MSITNRDLDLDIPEARPTVTGTKTVPALSLSFSSLIHIYANLYHEDEDYVGDDEL